MARFRGKVQGTRGEASRLGTAATGVTSTADGWHIGGEVEISDDNDRDAVEFTLSGGSNTRNSPRMVARYVEGDKVPTIYPAAFMWKEVGPIDDPAAVLRTEFRFGDAAAVRITAYDVRSNAAKTLNLLARVMIAGREYLFTMTAKETT